MRENYVFYSYWRNKDNGFRPIWHEE